MKRDQQSGPLAGVVGLLLICVLVAAQQPAELNDASIEHIKYTAEATSNGTTAYNQSTTAEPVPPTTTPVSTRGARQLLCTGLPSPSPYITWSCSVATPDGAGCSGQCVAGASSPYGSPLAVCSAGTWAVIRSCLAGGFYYFDDRDIVDGGRPGNFLGLIWSGLRVANSYNFAACNGYNGFKNGLVSGSNVAYTLEVGQGSDLSNLARITAPTPQSKISILGFNATAAWQEGLRIDVASWDAKNNQLGLQVFQLSFKGASYVDLRNDLRFSGIYRLTIISSGGQQVSCVAGKQVVIDNLEVYLHAD